MKRLEGPKAVGDYKNQCFQMQWGSGAYDPTMVMTTCLRLLQVQAKQHPSIDGRVGQEVLPLAEELLIINNFWCREVIFKDMALGRANMLQWWLHTQEYIARGNRTRCFLFSF